MIRSRVSHRASAPGTSPCPAEARGPFPLLEDVLAIGIRSSSPSTDCAAAGGSIMINPATSRSESRGRDPRELEYASWIGST